MTRRIGFPPPTDLEPRTSDLGRSLNGELSLSACISRALTSQPQKAGFPLTLELTRVALPKPTWVKISQIRTLSTARLGKRLGQVDADGMRQILEGLNEIIGEPNAAGYRR